MENTNLTNIDMDKIDNLVLKNAEFLTMTALNKINFKEYLLDGNYEACIGIVNTYNPSTFALGLMKENTLILLGFLNDALNYDVDTVEEDEVEEESIETKESLNLITNERNEFEESLEKELSNVNEFEKELGLDDKSQTSIHTHIMMAEEIETHEDLKDWMIEGTEVILEEDKIVGFFVGEYYLEKYPELEKSVNDMGYVSIDVVKL